MHKLDQTVNRALSAGVLLGGVVVSLIVWFLAYTQAKVDAFTSYTDADSSYLGG